MGDTWFSQTFRELASQLSSGALNEMKKRILNTRIQGEKLELNEESERMKAFFKR